MKTGTPQNVDVSGAVMCFYILFFYTVFIHFSCKNVILCKYFSEMIYSSVFAMPLLCACKY